MSKPRACVVDQCCCCVELSTGCFVIGYLSLLGRVAQLWRQVQSIGPLEEYMRELRAAAPVAGLAEQLHDAPIIRGFIYYNIGSVVLGLVFTVVLLAGLHQRNRRLLNVFLVYAYVSYVVTLVGLVVVCTLLRIMDVAIIVVVIVVAIPEVYFLVVLRSYYYKLEDSEEGPAVYSTSNPPAVYLSGPGVPPATYPDSHGVPPAVYPDRHGVPPAMYPDRHGVPPAMYPDRHGVSPAVYPNSHGVPPAMYPNSHGMPPAMYPARQAAPPAAYPANHELKVEP